eukprot:6466253-Amphidinium_carterae.1
MKTNVQNKNHQPASCCQTAASEWPADCHQLLCRVHLPWGIRVNQLRHQAPKNKHGPWPGALLRRGSAL